MVHRVFTASECGHAGVRLTAHSMGVAAAASVVLLLAAAPLVLAESLRVLRTPRREIFSYRSFSDVTVLVYSVPDGAAWASFNYTSAESNQGVGECPPRNVTVALKFGSFPAINPDGAAVPPFYHAGMAPLHQLQFLSDATPVTANISDPWPGDWYAVAFISYTDPDDDKIVQQGLTPSCITTIESALDIRLKSGVTAIIPSQTVKEQQLNEVSPRKLYKFFVPALIWGAEVQITIDKCEGYCGNISLQVSHKASFYEEMAATDEIICPPAQQNCKLMFVPWEGNWHYLNVIGEVDNTTVVTYELRIDFIQSKLILGTNETLSSVTSRNVCEDCWPRVYLMRQSFPSFFMYNFVRLPDQSGKTSNAVNVSTSQPTYMSLELSTVKDIGGVFTVQFKIENTSDLANHSASNFNVSVLICLSFGVRSEPIFPDRCQIAADMQTPLSVKVNTTSPKSYISQLHVPYPEPGNWFVTLLASCMDAEGAVTDCGELKQVTVSFLLESEPCGPSACGSHGRCFSYMSGGVIFSTCLCSDGYRGWTCEDGSAVINSSDFLLSVLLLTLSNLAFIPAIWLTGLRRYYTEALVYLFTMLFSTFYHACDAGSFCALPLGVLQFCDFFSAILAVWVTVVAMADLPVEARGMLRMAGCVLIALGTVWDRTSLAVFLTPALAGAALVMAAWGARCRRRRSCYPAPDYYKFWLPPGLVLLVVGLGCYAFLQTRANYKFVHSAWHAIMALTLLFALPARRYTAETDSEESLAKSFCGRTRDFRVSVADE